MPGELTVLPPSNISIPREVLKHYTEQEVIRTIENVRFQLGYPLCGAVYLNQNNELKVCTAPQGHNTDHQGTGYCFRHDQSIQSAELSPYTKHLLQYPTLQAMFEEFKNRGGEVRRLEEELAILRSVLTAQLIRLQKDKHLANEEIYKNIILCVEQIRRLTESMAKIAQIQAQGITMDSINTFLWQIMEVISGEVLDQDKATKIFERISTECRFVQNVA
jgi:hypothetical protein